MSSERSEGFSGPGRIPWTAVRSYADEYGLHGRQREDLFAHVSALDDEYLTWVGENQKSSGSG